MSLSSLIPIAFTILLIVCLFIIIYNRFIKKKSISNIYTPFDHITGLSEVDYHEEKLDKESRNAEGDDKDKNCSTE
ncbi:hypothetical protein J6TS2_04400 [Heyndrickxia sporothermodurans]|nr:hypothetical protein J6TS2_04400 [Heyndrickxia sporothermodurans]